MRNYFSVKAFFITCTSCILIGNSVYCQGRSISKKTKASDFRNFYGISWRGSAHNNLAYAKQMGYEYVFYQKDMELDSLSNNLYFYLETPEYFIYSRVIDTKRNYSPQEIKFYETHCSLKNVSHSFPKNMATGWSWDPGSNVFTVLLDFQQQKVISWAIDSILNHAKAIELRNPNFHFAGFAWDEPRPEGDFWDVNSQGKRVGANLSKWNSKDQGAKSSEITHEFSTYTDGHLEFYKQLMKRTRIIYPDVRAISEPYMIYDGWIKLVKDRSDAKEVTPDILCQEGPGTEFTDDTRIYSSGLIKRENVFSTTPDVLDDKKNLLLAAKASINGSWIGWYGRFGGTGDMPDFKDISEVPARLKLIRLLPNWETRNRTPIRGRNWNGSVYQSKYAFASSNIVAIRKPQTKKYFVVFLTSNDTFNLPSGNKILSVSRTNNLFIETDDGSKDFVIRKNTITLTHSGSIGMGYIVTIK